MPDLDVSDIVLDPDFAELVTITRRAQAIGTTGRGTITPEVFGGVVAVITAGPDRRLQRGEDYSDLPKSLTIHTTFRLRSQSPGFAPDFVTWNGNNYVVTKILDWSRFGAGFIAAEIESRDLVDEAPAA